MSIFNKIKSFFGQSSVTDDTDVLIGLGQKYYKQNDFERAQFFFGKAINHNPNNVDYLNMYGKALYKNNQIAGAINAFKKAINNTPGDMRAYKSLGNLYLDQSEPRAAIEIFNKAVNINPGFAEGYYQLGYIHYSMLNDLGNAVNYLKKSVNSDSINYNAYLFLGDIELNNQRYDEALIYYQNAAKVNGKVAEPFYKLGLVFEAKNNENAAFNYFDRVLEINDKHEMALFKIGKYYDLRGNKDLAIDYYKKAEKVNPENGDVLLNMGEAYFETDKLETAEIYLQRALKHNRNNRSAKVLLAKIWNKKNMPEEQIEILRSITDRTPDPEIFLMLAKAYGKMNNEEKEKEYYIKLAKLNNEEAIGWLEKRSITIE